MVKLFLKLYGPLLLAILIIAGVQFQVFGYVTARYGSENVRKSFLGVFNLVERELMRGDERSWDAVFEGLRPEFGHPVALSTVSKLAERWQPGDSRIEQLLTGRVVLMAEGEEGYSVARRVGPEARVLILTFTESRHIRNNLIKLNTLVQMVILTLLLIFWVWPLLRDMRRLQLAAWDIGHGRFHAPPTVGRWSVLTELQQALSTMANQIAKLLKAQKALTSGISHELRNPLMRIQYRHRLAQDSQTLQRKDAYLTQMQGDLDTMNELVDEVLVFSKMEYREEVLERQQEALAPMVRVLADQFESLVSALGKDVRLEMSTSAEHFSMDARHMQRAVGNLLANAARFAHSVVVLRFHRSVEMNEIRVEDDGPGINAEDAERVFRPFERLDESRDRATGGFGLGLAIVREVARLHGGAVSVDRSERGGARFIVRWPEGTGHGSSAASQG